jgi:acyl carrier protein
MVPASGRTNDLIKFPTTKILRHVTIDAILDNIDFTSPPARTSMNIAQEDIAGAVIEERYRTALAEFGGDVGLKDIDAHASLSDALDSLGHFTFLLTLEAAFQVEIPDEKFSFASMGNLAGVRQVLLECGANGQNAA